MNPTVDELRQIQTVVNTMIADIELLHDHLIGVSRILNEKNKHETKENKNAHLARSIR